METITEYADDYVRAYGPVPSFHIRKYLRSQTEATYEQIGQIINDLIKANKIEQYEDFKNVYWTTA
jgi:hypothetical protein